VTLFAAPAKFLHAAQDEQPGIRHSQLQRTAEVEEQADAPAHGVEGHFIEPCLLESVLLGERVHLWTAQ
jgi:hypothetical protein